MPATQSDCIFCKIASGEIPVAFIVENEHAVAFADMAPQAAEHVLVVPRRHVTGIADLTRTDDDLLGALIEMINAVAKAKGITGSGYRVVTNNGPDAGQTVHHLHLHVLGGEPLGHFGTA